MDFLNLLELLFGSLFNFPGNKKDDSQFISILKVVVQCIIVIVIIVVIAFYLFYKFREWFK